MVKKKEDKEQKEFKSKLKKLIQINVLQKTIFKLVKIYAIHNNVLTIIVDEAAKEVKSSLIKDLEE